MILPWTVRNYQAFGRFVLLNTNAGYCVEDDEGNGAFNYIGGSATPSAGYSFARIQNGTCLLAAGTAAS